MRLAGEVRLWPWLRLPVNHDWFHGFAQLWCVWEATDTPVMRVAEEEVILLDDRNGGMTAGGESVAGETNEEGKTGRETITSV